MKNYNYYALHYHMKKCGTRTVIENILSYSKFSKNKFALIESGKQANYNTEKKIKHIKIPEIDYNEKKFSSLIELKKYANKVAKKIENSMDFSKQCILHSHNVNLFKNSYLGIAILILAKKYPSKLIVLMQVHDFAEDSRPNQLNFLLNATGKYNQKLAGELAYPTAKNIFYLTINNRDKLLLSKIGIEKNRIFLFANAVDTKSLEQKPIKNNELINYIKKFAKKNGFYFDSKRKNIVYPVKLIKRKNVLESILILRLLNSIKKEYQLLITLDANSKEDANYSNKIKKFVKNEKLPVTIGFGWEIINPSKRVFEKNKIKEFIIPDLFYHSKSIITTSKLEGFGFTFLEGWLSNKQVVGRKINFIQKDFENKGIKFPGFYERIEINGIDFKDITDEEKIRVIKNYEKYDLLKYPQIKNTIFEIISPSKKIINNNKKIIKSVYSIKNYHLLLEKIINKSHKISIKSKKRIKKVDNYFLINYFKPKKEKKIIITDIDGTIVDNTYSLKKIKPVVEKIKKDKTILCFCTSKSFFELEHFRKKLNNKHPFILENGSAIFLPKNYFSFKIDKKILKKFNIKKIRRIQDFDIIELNVSHKETINAIKTIQKKLNFHTKIYSKLAVDEIQKITNLPKNMAKLSKIKNYADGLFVPKMTKQKINEIKKQAKKIGFNAKEGGRFVGINNGGDKGTSTKILLYLFKKEMGEIFSIGAGDSENDFEMLKEVNQAYLIKNKKNIEKRAKKEIKNLIFINKPAPNGWAQIFNK